MLALLGALKEEIVDLKNRMDVEEACAEEGCHLYIGRYGDKPVLLAQTGIGKRRAETATRLVLEQYPIATLVSFGFAGALTEEAKVGDVILCSTLYGRNGKKEESDQPRSACHSDTRLVSLASTAMESTSARVWQGNSVSVRQVVAKTRAKRELGEAYRAEAVDMESYWIAKIASESRIPFLAVRAISDEVQHNLPQFDQIVNSDGKLIGRKAFSYFLSYPHDLMKLITLRRSKRQASRNLTAFIDCLITRL